MFLKQSMLHILRSSMHIIASVALFSAATLVQASPVELIDGPIETSGGFRHNLFHSTSGDTLGWIALDSSLSNFYDADSGDIQLNYAIFDSSDLSNAIGTATGIGNLTASQFNHDSGNVIGTIDWEISLSPSQFLDYMETLYCPNQDPIYHMTMTYLDINYTTSGLGYVANSNQDGSMTLWGANNYNGDGFDSTLGMDIVVQAVPVPAAVWLFGTGLIGLVGLARRRVS